MKRAACILLLAVIAGCESKTTVDASSAQTAMASVIKMADELTPNRQEVFKDAVSDLMRSEEEAYKKYAGWNADQIINEYLKTR